MNLRTASVAALGCVAVLIVGCNRPSGAKFAARPTSAKSAEAPRAAPLESYRADAKSDPSARHFLVSSQTPVLATDIHGDYVEDFVRKPGNGIGRPESAHASESIWAELVAVGPRERNLGGARGGAASASYDPVTETLTLSDGTRLNRREHVWHLRDRQLMSVNGPKGPTVYLNSPRTQSELVSRKLTGASAEKVRLDAFEEEALTKLRFGDEVVLQSSGDRLRMLGAIRARMECLSCHDGTVGTLLGAFTYTLAAQSEETPEWHWLKDLAFLTDQQLKAVRSIEAVGGKVIRTSPGGPVTEVRMTFARNQETAAKPDRLSTRLQLRDSALPHLLAFPDLTVLDVSDSLVSDAGLKTIAELKSLKRLDLRQTWATVAGVAELKKALPKCEVITGQPVP